MYPSPLKSPEAMLNPNCAFAWAGLGMPGLFASNSWVAGLVVCRPEGPPYTMSTAPAFASVPTSSRWAPAARSA